MLRRKHKNYEKLPAEDGTSKKGKQISETDWLLIKAAQEKKIADAKEALKQGANPNATTPITYYVTCQPESQHGWLPHHHFIIDSCEVADDIQPIFFAKDTSAIYLAVTNNDTAMIEALTTAGATSDQPCEPFSIPDALNPDNSDKTLPKNETALHAAIRLGHTQSLERLLLNKQTNLNVKDANGDTPLLLAAKLGQLNHVTLLLAAKAKLGPKDKLGNNALHIAIQLKHQAMIEALTSHGLLLDKKHFKKDYINRTNKDGVTALQIAVSQSNVALTDFLLRSGASYKNISLHSAITLGSDNLVAAILSEASDKGLKKQLKKKNDHDLTPLEHAITLQKTAIVKRLLSYGAKVTPKEQALAASTKNADIASSVDQYAEPDEAPLAAESRLFKPKRSKMRSLSKKFKRKQPLIEDDVALTEFESPSISLRSSS